MPSQHPGTSTDSLQMLLPDRQSSRRQSSPAPSQAGGLRGTLMWTRHGLLASRVAAKAQPSTGNNGSNHLTPCLTCPCPPSPHQGLGAPALGAGTARQSQETGLGAVGNGRHFVQSEAFIECGFGAQSGDDDEDSGRIVAPSLARREDAFLWQDISESVLCLAITLSGVWGVDAGCPHTQVCSPGQESQRSPQTNQLNI